MPTNNIGKIELEKKSSFPTSKENIDSGKNC